MTGRSVVREAIADNEMSGDGLPIGVVNRPWSLWSNAAVGLTVSAILLSPRVVQRAFEPEPGGTSLFGFFPGAM